MFIRRTLTRRTGGQDYHAYRLVHNERDGDKVRQRTLLNLGSDFDLPKEAWPELCRRIDESLNGQAPIIDDTPAVVEEEAQRIVAQLLARGRAGDAEAVRAPVPVDVASLACTRPRSVGVEQVGLWAAERLGLMELLSTLGINRSLCTAAVASVVARLAYPASERATHAWLRERSALGELLGVDFETMGAMQLYRASDALVAHREAVGAHLFDRAMDLFELTSTVTLYDLTNTYYEGDVAAQPEARRGHSKEKRSDCKLLTLGLVLDGGGFVRRSRVFAGNVVKEDRTLSGMLDALGVSPGSLVVLDRGIATERQLDWLKANGYRYLVVSRERKRRLESEAALAHRTRSGGVVHLEKVDDVEAGEVRLYCYSEQRAKKERGMAERFAQRLERGLDALNEGLSRPRTQKKPEKIWQRIGRLVEKSRGIGQHYDITVATDESGTRVLAVTFRRKPVARTMLTHPGVYCLRSNETDWSEERLWRTFTLLTEVEAVFRSLKSELGLRPIHHHKPRRAEGHLFITVIAYQLVQVIRTRLAERGDESNRTASWTTLKRILGGRQRVTVTFKRTDGRTLHVRKATRPEPQQKAILDALGIASSAGGTHTAVV